MVCLQTRKLGIWGKRNDKSFEDWERTLEEIKSLFFKTLYLWTIAYVYSDFLVFFFFFFFFLGSF
jgi:hypothetical protein